jgi:hypothetical protein
VASFHQVRTSPVQVHIQAHFDRWEVEVNHRDEKSMFGVGEAQVWSVKAAELVPQFLVAVYAILLLPPTVRSVRRNTDPYMRGRKVAGPPSQTS